MKSSATLKYSCEYNDELYELLMSEDYDFGQKEISIKIEKNSTQVIVEIEAKTPQLLKIATTAVNDSCEIIRKTNEVIKNE